MLGTPAYMAPEQAGGDREAIGPAADVYALGAILYECLTGRPPFRAATVLETLEQVRTQEPVAPGRLQPGLPCDLETICLKCLDKDARRRYPSAQALADDLGRFLGGRPIRARPVSRGERLMKWARRQPALAALLVVGALSVAGFVIGVLVHNSRLRSAMAETQYHHQRADTGYRAARDTLDRMLHRLQRRQLGEVPQLKELQREQCEDALAFYQGVFAGAEDPDPEVRLDAARAHGRAASIQLVLGRWGDAETNFGRAIDLVEALPDTQRERPETQGLLASSYGDRGMGTLGLRLAAGRLADAERDLTCALAIYERLMQAQPDDPRWQESRARTEHQLGQMYYSSSRHSQAEAHYTQAVALRTALAHDHPQNPAYQQALAEDHVNLGLVYANTRRRAEAGAAYATVDTLLRPLIERYPDDARNALALAAADINWSLLLGDMGQLEAALTRATEAVELVEAVLKREPSYSVARGIGRNAHGVRAELAQRFNRWEVAIASWDRVVELDDRVEPVSPVMRALALARAGEHARALREATSVAAKPTVTPDLLYYLAQVCALSVEPAQADRQLSSAERSAAAERCASQGVALLRKLQASGYFRSSDNASALLTDTALQTLRCRADFWWLVLEVTTMKQPIPKPK
jgi:tetratricopeptide (TPR) repeat protein